MPDEYTEYTARGDSHLKWLQPIRGNARGCLIYEPMFILPYSLYMTYATVYMLRLGVGTAQIGTIASVGLILQLFSSAASGHLTDRLGRRRALLLFDLLSWTVATFIWAISSNVWFFVAAAVFNGFQRVPTTAWYCLLVEDTAPEDRASIFTGLQFISVISGLFVPLGGILVDRFGLVPAVRVMYGLACLSMTAMFYLRNRAVHETEIGLRKMRETRELHALHVVRQHIEVVREIMSNPTVRAVFAVYILNNFQATIVVTFLSIYEVSALGIAASWISLFPAVSAVATLLLMVFVTPRLRSDHALRYVVVGFSVSAIAAGMLVFAAHGSIAWLAIISVLSAGGTMVANPYLETLTANSIRDEERAKFLSVLGVLILLFTWPAGIIGGWAYGVSPRLPFVIVGMSLTLGVAILIGARSAASRNRETD